MKNLFAGKKIGFWFTLITAALFLISAIVYLAIYNGTNYLSMQAFWLLIGGAIVSVGMLFLNLERFAPALQFGVAVLALCWYIYYIYFFISSAIYGIQYSGLPVAFFVNVIFLALALIASIVNCFLPHKAEE